MQISGQITAVGQLGSPKGSFNICYQDIEITGTSGAKKTGNIGSKKGYQGNEQITVEVTEDPQYGTKFKRIDPDYAQGGSQGGGGQKADPARELTIKRGNALNAVMSATTIPSDMIGSYLIASMGWLNNGVWNVLPPNVKPEPWDVPAEPSPIEDDIPF